MRRHVGAQVSRWIFEYHVSVLVIGIGWIGEYVVRVQVDSVRCEIVHREANFKATVSIEDSESELVWWRAG